MKLQTRKKTARRRGLALIEVLICSSISAMLLTATAIAFRKAPSVMAYRDNNDRNITLSEGRIADAPDDPGNPPGRLPQRHQ